MAHSKEKNKIAENISEEIQPSELLSKELKTIVLNMLRKLKEIIEKEVKKLRKIVYEKKEI